MTIARSISNWCAISGRRRSRCIGNIFFRRLIPAYLPGGVIKYYQIENKRIPMMSYLSFDDPMVLTRGDMVRIGFAAKWG